jgi:hypothetical protein
MKVYRLSTAKDRESFKVPSTTTIGTYYTVDKLHTTADTFVYRCECIGYLTRQNKTPNFECKHISAVKSFLEEERKFNEEYN